MSVTRGQKLMGTVSANCRMVVNNMNKNTSAKMLQPERDAGFKPPEKSADFLIRALRPCERATVSTRKGHSWSATVAFLQARLGPFRLVFGPLCVSIIFKLLIVNVLKTSPNLRICARVGCPLQISQAQRPKTNK